MRNLICALALFFVGSAPAWSQKVSFDTPEKACRLRVKNRKDKGAKFAPFRGQLDSGLQARGMRNSKGIVMFAIRDARYKDQIFIGRASCLVDGASEVVANNRGNGDSGDDRAGGLHSGIYAKAMGIYFSEALTFGGTDGQDETLKGTNIGAALGLGYDLGGTSMNYSFELLPLFASSSIKNIGTIQAFEYTGKGIILGAVLNIVGHYHFSEVFGLGLVVPVGIRIQSFPSRPEGKIKEASSRPIYGAGLSMRADFGKFRLNVQGSSLFFKSDLLIGLGGELEL